MSERNGWLIVLSFLVCVVGVANAMLMSVTERFTEIATMKCLGAMDGFVMMMFVFEATIQGLIGGVIGLVLGSVLAVLRGLVEFGSLISGASSAAGPIGLGMLLALLVGMLLAAVAAVGPSFIAARLAPMEAMRVE
jgi:putative ABC transport system permease protein